MYYLLFLVIGTNSTVSLLAFTAITLKLSPPEHATPPFTDQREPTPTSNLSNNLFSIVYDKDNSDFNKELNILPDNEFHKNDLNMLQNFDEKPKITVLDLAKNNCFDNVHDVCGVNLVTSQVHTEFHPVLKATGLGDDENEMNKDSLIEDADVELENDPEQTGKHRDVATHQVLSDITSKLSNSNDNNHCNMEDECLKDNKGETILHSEPTPKQENSLSTGDQSVATKVKKKNWLMNKLNFFGKKIRSVKDVSKPGRNSISPVNNSWEEDKAEKTVKAEEEDREELQVEINQYTIDDCTLEENPLQKFKPTAEVRMPLSGRTKEMLSKYSIEDFTTKDCEASDEKTSEVKQMASPSKSSQNIKHQRSSPMIKRPKSSKNGKYQKSPVNACPRPTQKENYLATLKESGNLPPFMKVNADKYNLFNVPDVHTKHKQVVEQEEKGKSMRRRTLPRDMKLSGQVIENGRIEPIHEENPYVLIMSGDFSPERDETHVSRKRKSPIPKSVPVAKKRQMHLKSARCISNSCCSVESLMSERDFINDFIQKVLDDVVKDLRIKELLKETSENSIDPEDHTDKSVFSHHKEEFEQIRARFESGAISHRDHEVPPLSRLCTGTLDDWGDRFIGIQKKKYHVSSYSSKESNKLDEPDKQSNWSCASTSAAKSDIYEPYWDSKLNLTGDSLSENSFYKGIDSFSLDQPSVDICKKNVSWISPVRRDFSVSAIQKVDTKEKETSTMSIYLHQSTQTMSLDLSQYELIIKSSNLKPVQTRSVSTSPIHEFLMADLSMDDNKSQNSSNILKSSPCVTSKPRYSSSPIISVPNLDLSPDIHIRNIDEIVDHTNIISKHKVNQSEHVSRCLARSESYTDAQNSSWQNPSKVQRSRTLNYLSNLVHRLVERRRTRFDWKHLFVRHMEEPVELLSFKKYSDNSTVSHDNRSVDMQEDRAKSGLKIKRSPLREQMEKEVTLMKSCFPNEDLSTIDTLFNRSFDEDMEKDDDGSPPKKYDEDLEKDGDGNPPKKYDKDLEKDVDGSPPKKYDKDMEKDGDGSPPKKYDNFGKWSVSYKDKQPNFAFHKLDNTEKRFEFCNTFSNLIGCGGDKNDSFKSSNSDRTFEKPKNVEHETVCYGRYAGSNLEVINAPECSKSALGELLNSSDDSDGSFVKIDMNDQYAMFNFPEDPVPKDLKMPEEFIKDDSGSIVDDELSPDSLSFIASLTRDIRGHDFTQTPKATENDGDASSLNAFLHEALKPLDELLSDDSSNENLSLTQFSPSRWRCTIADYPSFVSFHKDDEEYLSDIDLNDIYPEPDVISEYNPVKLEQIISDVDLNGGKLHQGCKAPDNSERLKSGNGFKANFETLDDWLNFNEEFSEYTAFDRKARYPTFTFVTPHKTDHLGGGDSTAETSETTVPPTSETTKESMFSTPNTAIYQSPEPNTGDNTFVSVSEMSYDESRGCTMYYTDIKTDLDVTFEDPTLAITENDPTLDITENDPTLVLTDKDLLMCVGGGFTEEH
jgi:hypothetical protein